jgi:hypothetical protein
MKNYLMILFALSLVMACKHKPDNEGITPCMATKIADFKAIEQPCDHPSIKRYTSEIGDIYLFSIGDCPDAGASAFDSNCNDICFLGGIAGIIDCVHGGDTLHLTGEEIIWEK